MTFDSGCQYSSSVLLSTVASFATTATRWLAMCAAMAGCAVLEVPDSFPQMLGTDPVGLVLMAAIAGGTAGIVVHMARRAGCVVIAVEQEVP